MGRELLRRGSAALGAVFVPVFLTALLIQNLGIYLRRPLPLHAEAAELLSALGADQRWPMFGAYFPDHVRLPVIRIVARGHGTVHLRPTAGPVLSEAALTNLDPAADRTASAAPRWRSAFGTARIDKYESRAASPAPGWLGVRTAYTASRIRGWLADEGVDPDAIDHVDLLSVSVRSAINGAPLEIVRVDRLEIRPEIFNDWPAPRAEPLAVPPG